MGEKVILRKGTVISATTSELNVPVSDKNIDEEIGKMASRISKGAADVP